MSAWEGRKLSVLYVFRSAALFIMGQIGPILEIRERIKREGRFLGWKHILRLRSYRKEDSLHATELRALCTFKGSLVSSQFYCDALPVR